MCIFTKGQENAIIEMYKDKISIDTIIKNFNSTEHDIRYILKLNNVDRTYNFFSNELYKRICYLYQLKMTHKQIMYNLLIGEPVIKKTLLNNNISVRTYSENNRRFERNQHYFDVIDTQNKAYILGILYADGNNHSKHNSITLSLQEEDKELLESIRQEIGYNGQLRLNPLHEKNQNYKNQYVLNINDEYMSKKLYELGLVDAKSLILQFPKFLDEKLYSHFIRGYFDGDGHIGYYEPLRRMQANIVSTTWFCNKVSDILYSFGCKHCIIHPKQCHDNTMLLSICGNNQCIKFFDWLYKDADLKMNRKYQRYLHYCEQISK